MRSMIVTLLLALPTYGTQVFHYHDRVQVRSGFYEGCSGNVDQTTGKEQYGVYLDTDRSGNPMIYYGIFEAANLTKQGKK